MTRKQFGIIFTLLGLIVCTAVLAAKLNSEGLNDPTDLASVFPVEEASSEFDEETGAKSETETAKGSSDFFYDARCEREQSQAATVATLKSERDAEGISEQDKTNLTNEIQTLVLKQEKQNVIEQGIKNKGYEDSLCQISDDGSKASVIVKSQNVLSETEAAEIQEIVQNASSIKEVIIEVKN